MMMPANVASDGTDILDPPLGWVDSILGHDDAQLEEVSNGTHEPVRVSNGGQRIGRKAKSAKEGEVEKKPRRGPDTEQILDRGIKSLIGKQAIDYSLPDDWRSLREHLRIHILHPGKFVAFRDHFKFVGDTRRLVEREIICASRSLAAVTKKIDQLPPEEVNEVIIDYVEPKSTSPER
jgi:hypothetical protein